MIRRILLAPFRLWLRFREWWLTRALKRVEKRADALPDKTIAETRRRMKAAGLWTDEEIEKKLKSFRFQITH